MFKFTHGGITFIFSSAPESIDVQEGTTVAHVPIVKDAKQEAALDMEAEILERVIQENQPLPEQLQLVADVFAHRKAGRPADPNSKRQQVIKMVRELRANGLPPEHIREKVKFNFLGKMNYSGIYAAIRAA